MKYESDVPPSQASFYSTVSVFPFRFPIKSNERYDMPNITMTATHQLIKLTSAKASQTAVNPPPRRPHLRRQSHPTCTIIIITAL